MRCQFCGWDNPEGKTSCEKCNKPLVSSHSGSYQPFAGGNQNHGRPTDRQAAAAPGGSGNLKKTLREGMEAVAAAMGVPQRAGSPSAPGSSPRVPTQYVCPMCGYPMEHGVCASCGYDAGAKAAADDGKPQAPQAHEAGMACDGDARKTMRPRRKGDKEGMFSLTPISEETGQPEGEALRYEGNEVLLTRDNTDPRNKTITSHGQAEVVFADGKWTIKDKSQLKTTFVQAGEAVELKSGAIILLGNQLYRFDV